MKADLTDKDISRYIEWVKQYGVWKAIKMQREVEKSKKKFRKALQK